MTRLVALLAVVLACGAAIIAQSVDPAMLLKPPVDSWPTYHGDYSGQRHSKLAAITPANVHQLTLAWAFATNQTQQIKGTPILVNGVIYITTPDNIWAVDARTARQLWRYTYPANDAFHIGHRGAAVYKDSVFLTTPDAHLVALDARNGTVKWDVMIADAKRGFWSTNAPLLIRNHLIVGVAGDFDNLPGTLKSFDPDTGKVQWTFYSTPPPGTPDSTSGGATGGQMWMTGTYDSDLNLMYVGTGNPTPVLNGEVRPGDNPWTCSIVALNPDTGKLAWGFQASPHDTHDWDAAEVPVLVDGNFNGAPRKLLLQASRNGYFFVLDRTNGKSLLTTPFAAVNWAKGIDKDGRPIPNPDKEPLRDGRLVAPNEAGATNYRSPSFDPRTGLLVVSAVDAYGIYFFKKEHGAYGWAGANSSVWSRAALRAIDYQTGKIRWSHDLGEGAGSAGVLTTDTGLTFTGDNNGNVLALRTSDGTTLWHAAIGRVGNSPVTYELDGRQYVVLGGGSSLYAFALPQSSAAAAVGQQPGVPAPKTWTAQEDHQNMMDQLGIKALRPGPSGNEQAPNHANYDEATANPFPKLPDVLTLKSGGKVTSAAMWETRRKEILEDFDREVLGRVPRNVPTISWTETNRVAATVGGRAVVGRQLVGHVDNSAYPAIDVDIQMTLVTPADAKGPVPVMMMFGARGLPGVPAPPGARAGGPPAAGSDPPATDQLIADGWGYASISPVSIQADNGAGLTRGIIGLVNKGQARKPDDWGALRAWAWGASRALDYLETDTSVDAKHVGIEGVSRYGKAALVTMAYDTRFASVLVGSSGEGGAKLHRRNWGEAVENLTGSGEYHWMAGNFLKYGASQATFGSRNAGDIPVDAHELIALCAPRLTFVSYGVPEKGDAKWLDHQGSYMAAIAAQPAFRLLGAKGLGKSDDYTTEKMPAVNVGLLDGHLAWRQHDGGHTDGPNWKYFIPWADRFFGRVPSAPATATLGPADRPAPRTDQNSMTAHAQLLDKARQGGIDVYFLGDSITRRWGALDYPNLLANWQSNFFGWNAANFGWGADRVENILWRLEHGELDGVNPKVIVLQAGTNNIGARPGDDARVAEVTRGFAAIIYACRQKAPAATIVVTAIFPRNDNMAVVPEIERINANLGRLADGRQVRYLNINEKLADRDGKLFDGMMNPDHLHPALPAYQIWADALKPIFMELLGPSAAIDRAPPATGDPSAQEPRR